MHLAVGDQVTSESTHQESKAQHSINSKTINHPIHIHSPIDQDQKKKWTATSHVKEMNRLENKNFPQGVFTLTHNVVSSLSFEDDCKAQPDARENKRSCEYDKPREPSCNKPAPIHPRPSLIMLEKEKKTTANPSLIFPPAPVFQCDARSPQSVVCVGFPLEKKANQDRPSHPGSAAVSNWSAVKLKAKQSSDHPISHPVLCMPTPPITRKPAEKSNLKPLYKKRKGLQMSWDEWGKRNPPNYKFLGGEAEEIR